MNLKLTQEINDHNLPTIYNAFVDYHNTMVQIRFTIAGLFIAATGFLINSWFNLDHQKSVYSSIIPIIGVFLTLLCWLLEFRTKHLLINLEERGIKIEQELVNSEYGFFDLMKNQPIPPKFPFSEEKLKSKKGKKIISHTFAFNLIYLIIISFWILTFFIWMFGLFSR